MSEILQKHPAEELADEILAGGKEHVRARLSKRTPEKRDYMYLSDIHSCGRHNFYSMAEGDKRKPFSEWTDGNLEAGEIWEDVTVSWLGEMGFRVNERNVPVQIKSRSGKLIARGRIDGTVTFKGSVIPAEIKNLDPNVFGRINEVDDLFRQEWTEKYVRQLLMYLYGRNEEAGLFIIGDRAMHYKILVVFLGNYIEYAERVLQLIEKAHAAKEAGQAPDRITYNHRLCGNCQFAHVCLPTMVLEGAETLTDPELEAKLARHEELKPLAKQYDELHDDVVAFFKEKPQVTVGGRFVVIPKSITKKTFDWKALKLTKEQLAEIQGERTEWRVEIQDASKKPEAADR